jgi:hypothetical protein
MCPHLKRSSCTNKLNGKHSLYARQAIPLLDLQIKLVEYLLHSEDTTPQAMHVSQTGRLVMVLAQQGLQR